MRSNITRDSPRACARCTTTVAKLHRCESGFACDACLADVRRGRDVTTRLVKASTVATIDGEHGETAHSIEVPVIEPTYCNRQLAPLPDELTPAIINADARDHRHQLLGAIGNEATAMALATQLDTKPANDIQVMLTHQLAVAHKAALDASSRAFLAPDPTEQARLFNVSARLMETFQKGALALQRLRNGGNQQILVQHVNVGQGGQAIVGNVQAGGCP